METLTIYFDNKGNLNEREEKTAQKVENNLNGLTFSEVNRVLARVISKVNNAMYWSSSANKPVH